MYDADFQLSPLVIFVSRRFLVDLDKLFFHTENLDKTLASVSTFRCYLNCDVATVGFDYFFLKFNYN